MDGELYFRSLELPGNQGGVRNVYGCVILEGLIDLQIFSSDVLLFSVIYFSSTCFLSLRSNWKILSQVEPVEYIYTIVFRHSGETLRIGLERTLIKVMRISAGVWFWIRGFWGCSCLQDGTGVVDDGGLEVCWLFINSVSITIDILSLSG